LYAVRLRWTRFGMGDGWEGLAAARACSCAV
jgi:hypothetical protein